MTPFRAVRQARRGPSIWQLSSTLGDNAGGARSGDGGGSGGGGGGDGEGGGMMSQIQAWFADPENQVRARPCIFLFVDFYLTEP